MRNKSTPYSQEARELVRNISMYPGISLDQLYRFQPGKKEKVHSLLSYLVRQGRIVRTENARYYANAEVRSKADGSIARAVWVLLDFLDMVQYHAAGEYPVTLYFFGKGVLYEVIHIPVGQEIMVSQLLQTPTRDSGRRIVLVDKLSQIAQIDFPDIVAFCTVSNYGKVNYYDKGAGK